MIKGVKNAYLCKLSSINRQSSFSVQFTSSDAQTIIGENRLKIQLIIFNKLA